MGKESLDSVRPNKLILLSQQVNTGLGVKRLPKNPLSWHVQNA